MRYREIQPCGEARSFVDCYWILEHEASEPADVQRIVPDGRPELILNLAQPFESFQDGRWRVQPGCFFAGQITGPLLLRPCGPAKIFGVRFLAHGAARVLGVPAHELTGRMVPVADLAPCLARSLDDARESASLVAVEASLSSAGGAADLLIGEAVRHIVGARGLCNLAELALQLGVSPRQLERRFQRAVGMAPKLFCRIERFQRIFRVIEHGRPNWVEAAVECGYYDQAHLIRDFQEFSGKTPAVLLADAGLARHFLSEPLSHFSKTAGAPSG